MTADKAVKQEVMMRVVNHFREGNLRGVVFVSNLEPEEQEALKEFLGEIEAAVIEDKSVPSLSDDDEVREDYDGGYDE